MTIHLVIFIAQLEPVPNDPDFYGRTDDKDFPPVIAKNDDVPKYKIKRFVSKRFLRNRFQYFVKWKSYGMEHNTWYGADDFKNAKKTIADYEEFNEDVEFFFAGWHLLWIKPVIVSPFLFPFFFCFCVGVSSITDSYNNYGAIFSIRAILCIMYM